jgi:hypothetical protein
MFAVTFVGHQGWVFRSKTACILVDPLLCEEFGHSQALDYRMYPPRQLQLERFPKVDAVFLSHEHDDHFDIPSLALLDRKIPIFLSSRSSVAGYKILVEMGFSVQPLVPGASLRFAELEFTPLCGDHVNTGTGDEWDTLPFLVEHTGKEGSFFSTVDCPPTPAHLQMVKSRVPKAGIVGWTNNALDPSHMCDFLPEQDKATEQFTQRLHAANREWSELWSPPSATLVCAGGFSFYGSREWLNQRVFCIDTERACQSLENMNPKQRFFATRPGQTFYMQGNRLQSVDEETPFLKTQPRELWPSRSKDNRKNLPDYAPATGKTELGRKDLSRLRQKLNEFADALVGSPLFRGLHSLLGFESQGIITTFALVLRDGQPGQELLFAYNPNACAFDLIDASRAGNPRKTYLAGMECWASDLLAVLSGELGPIAISFGRTFLWNARPDFFHFDIFGELSRMSHPLRRPAEYFRTYERQWKKCAGVQPVIQHRE